MPASTDQGRYSSADEFEGGPRGGMIIDKLPKTVGTIPEELVALITGRRTTLFAEDLEVHGQLLRECVRESRILVIGAAGSVGSAFVRQVVPFGPKGLVLVDIDENNLADLVRDLRSGNWSLPTDFSTSVVAMNGAGFDRFIDAYGPFEIVLNFAALKHVRSERDPFSLMRMIEANVFAVEDLLRMGSSRLAPRFFAVSSDKAVMPTSLMGATKTWMERVLSSGPADIVCTTARFANVAFSAGSLSKAFLDRLAQRQPLAAPQNISRFFISEAEAGQLCLLAAFLGEAGEVFVPRLDAEHCAIRFDEIARRVLAYYNLDCAEFESEAEAKASLSNCDATPRAWPCYFSPADTTGEKPVEEFLGPDEEPILNRFRAIGVVPPRAVDVASLAEARQAVEAIARSRSWHKEALVDAIRMAVPELGHDERNQSLDDKM